jgi:hypothetical protein
MHAGLGRGAVLAALPWSDEEISRERNRDKLANAAGVQGCHRAIPVITRDIMRRGLP